MKPETSAALKVIALGCAIIFFVFLGLSAPFYMRQREVLKTWPRTEGKIEAAQVVSLPGKAPRYTARFLVQYRLGDSIVSTTVNSGYGERFRSRAEAWVNRFQIGTTVTIAYDPLNPTNIRIDPGYNRYFFGAPLFITEVGLAFAAIAVLLYVIARSSRQPTRNSAVTVK